MPVHTAAVIPRPFEANVIGHSLHRANSHAVTQSIVPGTIAYMCRPFPTAAMYPPKRAAAPQLIHSHGDTKFIGNTSRTVNSDPSNIISNKTPSETPYPIQVRFPKRSPTRIFSYLPILIIETICMEAQKMTASHWRRSFYLLRDYSSSLASSAGAST